MNYETYEVKVFANGNKYWYQNRKLHRLDGPACEYANGNKFWLQNDKFHRLDNPACEYANGDKFWYQNDKFHRLDGPACEYANGAKSWYIEDVNYTEEEFNQKVNPQKPPSCSGKIVEIEGRKYKLEEVK